MSAAGNERAKLRATYYNTLAAGLFVSGFAVPYFIMFTKFPDVAEGAIKIWRGAGTWTRTEALKVFAQFAPLLIALFFAFYFQRAANREMRKIK